MPRSRMSKTRALVKAEVNKALSSTTEVKKNDQNWSFDAEPVPIAINLLDYIQIGDTSTQRTGNRVNLLSASLRTNLSTGQPAAKVRTCVLETREPLPRIVGSPHYDAKPCFEQLTTLGVNSFFDMDSVKRIHHNKLSQFTQLFQQGNDAQGQPLPINQEKYVNKYVSFGKRGKRIFYDGNAVADPSVIPSGNTKTYLYFVVLSDINIPGQVIGDLSWKCRYTDS